MNRAQRRNKANVDRSRSNNRIPLILEVDISQLITVSGMIKAGDTFTISGHKRLSNGSWITDCEPGTETVMRAVVKASPST